MTRNKIIPYNPKLRERARFLRKNSTPGEIRLWQKIRRKALGVQFHRQVPIDNYIVDFFCHELGLVIEIDGFSHQFSEQYQYDLNRQSCLIDFGLKIVRFSEKEVMQNIDEVIDVLVTIVEQGTHGLPDVLIPLSNL